MVEKNKTSEEPQETAEQLPDGGGNEQSKENKPRNFAEKAQNDLNDLERIKKWTNHYVQEAEENLENMLGQANLSTIEKAKLREIAENCFKQKLEEIILYHKGEMPADKMIDVQNEIVYRWLWEIYDIKRSDIPGRPFGNETLDVPEDFREYLRRLRGDSHLI